MERALPGIDSDLFSRFMDGLRNSAGRILLLDYDGTLAPFRIDRASALPYPGVREALNRILDSGAGRLVIISGRAVESLIPLLGLDKRPEIWGSHGVERLFPDGRMDLMPLSAEQQEASSKAVRWAAKEFGDGRVEIKPGGVAVHWRGMPEGRIEELKNKAKAGLDSLAASSGMEIHEFDGGMEMRVRGRDKGYAVRTVLEESGPGAFAAYLGDDLTDEDAFRAIDGKGLSVLVREEWRPTQAGMWIRPPQELIEFLNIWAGAGRAT